MKCQVLEKTRIGVYNRQTGIQDIKVHTYTHDLNTMYNIQPSYTIGDVKRFDLMIVFKMVSYLYLH